MKIAWSILLITAFTDFIITAGTALGTAIASAQSIAEIPVVQVLSPVTIILACVGGLVSAARTVQAALKASSGINPSVTTESRGRGIRP